MIKNRLEKIVRYALVITALTYTGGCTGASVNLNKINPLAISLDLKGKHAAAGLVRDLTDDGDNQEQYSNDNSQENPEIPRVIYQGDIDGDGMDDWSYIDREGNPHYAQKLFWDGKKSFNTEKIGKYKIPCFKYFDSKVEKVLTVPNDALIIGPN